MHFKLIYGNHQHYGLHVADIFLMLKYSLESVGHVADIEYDFVPGYLNVMLECFNDDFVENIEKSWGYDSGLIVVATEFLTGHTFNEIYSETDDVREKNDHNQRREYWQKRYNNFSQILPYVLAVWHPAEQQVPIFRKAFPTTNIEYLPHLYCKEFNTVNHRSDSEKDIDILFTGTLTHYRKGILKSLSDAGMKVETSSLFTAPFHREDLISRAKIVLNIKQHSDWEYESVGRLHYHISNDSLIITDQYHYFSSLHKYACIVGQSWSDSVKEQLALGGYSKRAQSARRSFANEQSSVTLFNDFLKKSNVT